MTYKLAYSNFGKEEKQAIQDVVESGNYSMGPKVFQFEEDFADSMATQNAIMVNSGSSANLLMLAAMKYVCGWQEWDEIIVPALSWSTTYFPLHQYRLTCVFADIDPFTWNIDFGQIEKLITPRTRAILAVNVLGMPANLSALRRICDQHDLVLIEDNCESFGAIHRGRFTGRWGEMASHSFFFSHHLQTMEGGMIITDDDRLSDVCKTLRAHGWTRELRKFNTLHQKNPDPFVESFRFILPGYNLRPTEMSGAIGIEQLKKWNKMNRQRQKNAKIFVSLFGDEDFCTVQRENKHDKSSWYGFGVVLKEDRAEIVEKLTKAGIETRPIIAGNILNQPVIRHLKHRCPFLVTNTQNVDENGLFFGNGIVDLKNELETTHGIISEHFSSK